MKFFVGLHQPSDAIHFDHCFISVNRLRDRRRGFPARFWILDSGAFTTIAKHGYYPESPEEYAEQINRWSHNGALLAAVSQDYMCEPVMLAKTGLTIAEHQEKTIGRFLQLRKHVHDTYVMPVLQGYQPAEYAKHVADYGSLLNPGAWVGVGSVCKRNGDPAAVVKVLSAIKDVRPDLKLHGFGLKTTSLKNVMVRSFLHSADSMAWSFAARKEGRNGNDWREAERLCFEIAIPPRQYALDLYGQPEAPCFV